MAEGPAAGDRARTGAAALAVAGAALLAHPALRPFGDAGTPLEAATAYASAAWTLAHLLGVLGFALLPLGLLGLRGRLAGSRGERGADLAVVLGVLGSGAVLPYYGAETYGLRAVGRAALSDPGAGAVALVEAVRLGPGAAVFAAGLLLVAAAPAAPRPEEAAAQAEALRPA